MKRTSSARFHSPTRSSAAKIKPAANLRERVKDINERIDILNGNQSANSEYMEKNYLTLSHQIKALRQAFAELGENFLTEMVGLKEEITKDYRREFERQNARIGDVADKLARVREEGAQQTSLSANFESRLNAQFHNLEEKSQVLESEIFQARRDIAAIHDESMRGLEDAKYELQSRTNTISTELERLLSNLATSDRMISQLSKSVRDEQGGSQYRYDKYSSTLGELQGQLLDLKSTFNNETAVTGEKTTMLNEKVCELTEVFLSRIETIDSRFEDRLRALRQDQGILESRLGSTLAEIETQAKYDIHSQVRSVTEGVGEDNRQMGSRLRSLEDEVKTILSQITQVERSTNWKNDNVVRAVQSISRQLNLPNPIYS